MVREQNRGFLYKSVIVIPIYIYIYLRDMTNQLGLLQKTIQANCAYSPLNKPEGCLRCDRDARQIDRYRALCVHDIGLRRMVLEHGFWIDYIPIQSDSSTEKRKKERERELFFCELRSISQKFCNNFFNEETFKAVILFFLFVIVMIIST